MTKHTKICSPWNFSTWLDFNFTIFNFIPFDIPWRDRWLRFVPKVVLRTFCFWWLLHIQSAHLSSGVEVYRLCWVLRHSDSCSAASVARLLGRPFCGMGVSSWVPPNADLQAVVEMTFKGAGRFSKRALTRHLWEIPYFSVCYSVPQNVETVEVAIFLL